MLNYQGGPLIVFGSDNPTQLDNADAGPSLFYQGLGISDPRYLGTIRGAPGIPGYPAVGLLRTGWLNTLDILPTTRSATVVAAAQATTTATAMTLATVAATGIVCSVPLIPFGSAYASANVVTTKLALDFGFCAGTTTAASKTIASLTAGAYVHFRAGQKIVVCGAGGTDIPQIMTVATTPAIGATTLTTVEAATAAVTGGRIGFADITGVAAFPYIAYGSGSGRVSMLHPDSMCSRVLSIVATNGGATGGTFAVVGYDAYGKAMTESIVHAGGATTIYGLKTWKYITSITPNFTDAQTYSVGNGDVFGLPIRSDFFEDTELSWVAAWATANTGWLPAITTSPATATTGDVRGTIQLGTLGGGTGYTTSPNASRRLKVFQAVPNWMAMGTTILNTVPMFGVSQA